ncbi:MAG: serine/threonine-protein kinase [Opitutus sp.]
MNNSNSTDVLLAHLRALPLDQRRLLLQQVSSDNLSSHEVPFAEASASGVGTRLGSALSSEAMVRALASAMDLPASEEPGARIGPYKLLEQIGEGGFGVVWMAEQTKPIRRQVACKIIKIGMDTREVIARFEAERQALALMDHPNIARVFDAGATENGRPYFVMELVRGVALTRYCDEQRLSTEARLRLFITVCRAVQHAHQKGIIHRDLKPSNILVTLHDGVAVPKVIDFGIAKATQGRLTDKTLFTHYHAFLGTPAYASPEQMEMSGLDLDTRSDLYSLGALLYELLAGRPPFDPAALAKSGMDEMRHTIREVDPPLPSLRLSTLSHQERASVARERGADLTKLSGQLRGDLDCIVMRCLEKDRKRRYETASALAADIQRHLDDEPVMARPPGAIDQLRKSIRRHRFGYMVGTVGLLAVLAGVIMLSVMLTRERAARGRETALRGQAEANAETARIEAARNAEVARFMREMLSGVGPNVALGRNTAMLRDIADTTARRLDTELRSQPEVAADLRETLAGVYRDLGSYDIAEPLVRAAVGARRKTSGNETAELASALDGLGETLRRLNKPTDAEAALQEALAIRRKLFGENHPAYADTLFHLALTFNKGRTLHDVEKMLHEVLAIRRQAFGDEHRTIADTLAELGNYAAARGDHKKAVALHTEALAMYRKLFEPEHPEHPAIAQAFRDLGFALAHVGRRTEAMQAYREAFEAQRRVLGDQHPQGTIAFLRTIEQSAAGGGDLATITFVRNFIANQRRQLPPGSPLLAPPLLALAAFLESREEDPNEIRQLRAEASGLFEKSRTPRPTLDVEIIAAMEQFSWWRHNNRAPTEGIVMIDETIKLADAAFGPDGGGSLAPNRTLGWIYFSLHRIDAAIPQFEKAIRLDLRWTGPFHRFTCMDKAGLAAAYREAGRLAESRHLLEESLATWDNRKPDDPLPPTNIGVARAELGITLNRIGEFTEAERVLRASLREYELDGFPPLSARNRPRGRAESALGQALVGQRRFAEAEPLLVHALQDLRSTRDILGGDAAGVLQEAQEAVVALYDAWGKPDKAAEWRAVQL